MEELVSKLRAHFRFSGSEVKSIIIVILISAFILAFDDGRKTFNAALWSLNFLNTTLIVLLVFLIHISSQKVLAIANGYVAEFKPWLFGLSAGVLLTLASGGKAYLILPGGIMVSMMAVHRLGRFRYGLNYGVQGWVAAAGPLANLLTGMFVKELMNVFSYTNPLLDKFIFVNFLIAFFTMLPFPPLPGVLLFRGTRMGYAFLFSFILAYLLLFHFKFFSLVWAVIIAFVAYLTYWLVFEKEWW